MKVTKNLKKPFRIKNYIIINNYYLKIFKNIQKYSKIFKNINTFSNYTIMLALFRIINKNILSSILYNEFA